MKLFPASLLWRTLVVLIVALILSQVAAVWVLHRYVTQPRHAAGIGQFVSHLKTIGAALNTMGPAQRDEFIGRVDEQEGIRIVPVRGDERMRPVAGLHLLRERIHEIFGPGAEIYVRGNEGPRDPAHPHPRDLWIRIPTGDRGYWVAFPIGRVERDPLEALIAWGAVGLVIAVAATFFLMWRLNRPLGELARAAVKLGKGGDPPPVSETGPSEIRAVARAFNQMKDDLQHSQRERATFLAGISHDLRTPLSRLRLEVEMLGAKVDGETQRGIVQDLDDMNAIIDQFIDFTRSEAAEPSSAVNLAELARSCAERALRTGASVRCELDEVPLLMLRPLALQRLVDNLLVNAVRHAGGEIVVRVSARAGHAILSVLDRGPGIPAALTEHLKQPFTRRDEARSGLSGAGLGLAIADRVATLHGGRLDLIAREGGGLEARVTLPCSA